jgi:hypothetical protein
MTLYVPDVMPKLLTDIRSDTDVAAITTRIRSPEPAAPIVNPSTGAVIDKGDARQGTAADPYVAFVVLIPQVPLRHHTLPVQFTRTVARCYGRTAIEAAQLRWAVGAAIHNAGPRVYPNGLGIYASYDIESGEPEKDPTTQQPYMELVIEAPATTQAVA